MLIQNSEKKNWFYIIYWLTKFTNFLAFELFDEGVGVESVDESRVNVFFDGSS